MLVSCHFKIEWQTEPQHRPYSQRWYQTDVIWGMIRFGYMCYIYLLITLLMSSVVLTNFMIAEYGHPEVDYMVPH